MYIYIYIYIYYILSVVGAALCVVIVEEVVDVDWAQDHHNDETVHQVDGRRPYLVQWKKRTVLAALTGSSSWYST